MTHRAFVSLAVLLCAAAPLSAQEAGAALQPGAQREFSPFLTPGYDYGRYAPQSRPRSQQARDLDGAGSFDFDELMTPNSRGAKRSLQPRESVFDPNGALLESVEE